MSHDLYFTRLHWVNGRGVAKLHGRQVKLQVPPQLPDVAGLIVEEIDYTPEVRCCRLRPQFGVWRDMEKEEIRAADLLLAKLT